MPAPVTFLVTTAPLSADFDGTPEELNQAIAQRLVVTPAEPWSSFRNGGTTPTSDVGPFLANGQEWKVWNSGTGAYIPHVQDGLGIKDRSMPLSKIANGDALGSIIITNAFKQVAELTSAGQPNGSVLTLVDSIPMWTNTFIPSQYYFEATLTPATPQTVEVNNAEVLVNFNAVRTQSGDGSYDATNKRILVNPNEVWYLYAQVQIEKGVGDVTALTSTLWIRRVGVSTYGLSTTAYTADVTAAGIVTLTVGGVLKSDSPGGTYFDVGITCDGTAASAGDDVIVAANATSCRFGGYRIL